MAYRKIHDDFWTDPDMEEFTPEQKFFYLYLITNPSVNQIGLYEFSIRRACFETGYNQDTIEKLLSFFEKNGKIKRSKTTRELLVVKFWHHNKSNSPKVITHVKGLLSEVKDTALIGEIYGMDTVSYSIDTASQEEEEKEEEEKKPDKSAIPTLDEVKEYFRSKGYDPSVGERAYNIYQASIEDHPHRRYWRDSRGNMIKNWKLKMQAVWFTPENKLQGDDFNPDKAKQLAEAFHES